jgi:hypothetical protein
MFTRTQHVLQRHYLIAVIIAATIFCGMCILLHHIPNRLTVECDRLIAGLKLLTARLLPLPLPLSSDDGSDSNDARGTVSRKDVEALQSEAKALFKLMFATLAAGGNPPGWEFTDDEKVCVLCVLQYSSIL